MVNTTVASVDAASPITKLTYTRASQLAAGGFHQAVLPGALVAVEELLLGLTVLGRPTDVNGA